MQVKSAKFMIMVADMNRAIQFYHDGLGLNVTCRSSHWTELSVDGAVIALHGGGDGKYKETGLSLEVDDIYEATDIVRRAQGVVVNEPQALPDEGIVLADFIDPEGNTFMLSSPLADAA